MSVLQETRQENSIVDFEEGPLEYYDEEYYDE